MTALTRRYRFSASHRLHVESLDEQQNSALFGKCNNPFGHGHDYLLSVTVEGPIDSASGLIVPPAALDRMVENCVLREFAHRNLNLDHPRFAHLVPTTENVALVVADLLEAQWPRYFGSEIDAHLSSVHVQETERNGFEVRLCERRKRAVSLSQPESAIVHA